MERRTEPYNLKININNDQLCQCCNNFLKYEIKKAKYQISKDCGYCVYSDRPFTTGSSSLHVHYPDGCTCEYDDKEFLYITCNKCKSPSCTICNEKINHCYHENCATNICDNCKNKKKFNNTWEISTPQEKLILHGIKKLHILAKNKKIKGYSKYKRGELIKILNNVVDKNDFPIKKI
jgi:hypothetical protein